MTTEPRTDELCTHPSGPRPAARRRRPGRGLRALLVLAVALPIGLGAAAADTPAFADSLSDQREAAERKAREAEKRERELEASLEGLDAEAAQVVLDLAAVEKQLPAAREAYDTAQSALNAALRVQEQVTAQLTDAQDRETAITEQIARNAEEATRIRTVIAELARAAFSGEQQPSTLGLMLGSQSADEFVSDYAMAETALRSQQQALEKLKAAEADDRNAQARLVAVRERIAELKAEADAQVAVADEARNQAAAAKNEVERLVTEQQRNLQRIDALKVQVEAELAALEESQRQIAAEIADIIAKQRAQNQQTPTGSVGSGIFANPTSFNPMVVTSEYGWRMHPVLGYERLHAGIDLRAYCGTKIYAGRSGTVIWAQYRAGLGNSVGIDHGYLNGNSVMSSYNHLSSFVVGNGQQVTTGQLIGYAGNTGTSSACHLHLEVYINGATVNPAPYL